ncbi:MAG: hypothetical protein KC425_01740, partial [Anaerolineales bacterium]|nr:hypothetical protein [Anaerolineales bacterium]
VMLLAMGASGAAAAARVQAPAPTVVVPGERAADTAVSAGTFGEQVVELVNAARWDNGQLPPLKGETLLHAAAQGHSDNMAGRDFFAHCDLDTKTSPGERMTAAGYSGWNYAGENIAAGYSTPVDVMNGWMNSSGHRANILSLNYREIGVGYTYQGSDQANVRYDSNGDCNADGTYTYAFYRYWTQNFGRRGAVYPVIINREAVETDSRSVALYVYGQGWATEMRFRNEGGSWSAWRPYAPDAAWTLSSGNGLKTVQAEIRDGGGSVRGASDTILLDEVIVEPVLTVTPAALTFLADTADPRPSQQAVTIGNAGQVTMTWQLTAQPAVGWLGTLPATGSLGGGTAVDVPVPIEPPGLSSGTYTTTLTVDAGSAQNSPQQVAVTLIVADLQTIYLPLLRTINQ